MNEGTPVRGLAALVRVEADPERDEETSQRTTRQARAELAELDVDQIRMVEQDAPEGSKGTGAALGAILITMSTSGTLPALMETLGAWLGRVTAARRVSVTIDGDTIQLERASSTEQRALVDAFVSRHTSE